MGRIFVRTARALLESVGYQPPPGSGQRAGDRPARAGGAGERGGAAPPTTASRRVRIGLD